MTKSKVTRCIKRVINLYNSKQPASTDTGTMGSTFIGKNISTPQDQTLHSRPFKRSFPRRGFVIIKLIIGKVIINIADNETFKSSLRIFNKAYKTNIELQITTFYYRIFLLFSQLWNLQNNCSYIHASAVEVNGMAILFTADSGVGKSALLFQLSQYKNFKFIADDLTIISDKSESFFQGRCLSVKPYHLKFYSFLSEKLKVLMGNVQKLQWNIINDNRLTYRMSPTDIFDSICDKTEIKRIIHLCNHSKETFEINNISSHELINFTIPILSNELFLANHKLDKVASLPNSPFQSTDKMYNASRNIFTSAFKDVEIKIAFVPYQSNPIELFNFLKQEGCLN